VWIEVEDQMGFRRPWPHVLQWTERSDIDSAGAAREEEKRLNGRLSQCDPRFYFVAPCALVQHMTRSLPPGWKMNTARYGGFC